MAQRPKEEVRDRIVAAAGASFAERGYVATTLGAVAERAGVSTGNVYRYFEGKEALLDAVLPASFAADVRRRTRAKVEALGEARDVRLLARDARYHVLSGELLDFCIAHPTRVVILLARGEGTPFASFAADFRADLVALALGYVARAWPSVVVSAEVRFALDRIYASFLGNVGEAFIAFQSPAQIREAVLHLTNHHQGGLKHLFEMAAAHGGEHAEPGRSSHPSVVPHDPVAPAGGTRARRPDPKAAPAGPRPAHRRGRARRRR